jgi:hypothetical protein
LDGKYLKERKFMAKFKVVGTQLNSDLQGESFRNDPSAVASLSNYLSETRTVQRTIKDYSQRTGVFSRPITLESLQLDVAAAETVRATMGQLDFNIDPSKLNNYAYFGNLSEYLRVAIEGIIRQFPASLPVTSFVEGPQPQPAHPEFSVAWV